MTTAIPEAYAPTRLDEFTALAEILSTSGVPELADEVLLEVRIIEGIVHGRTLMWSLERTDAQYELAEACRVAQKASTESPCWMSLSDLSAAARCLCTERILATGEVMTPWPNSRRSTQAILATLASVGFSLASSYEARSQRYRLQRLVDLTEAAEELAGLSHGDSRFAQLIEETRDAQRRLCSQLRASLLEEGAGEMILTSLRGRASQRAGFQARLDERPTLVGIIGNVLGEPPAVTHLAMMFELRRTATCWVGYLPRYGADSILRNIDEHLIVQSVDAPSAEAAALASALWDPGPEGASLYETYQSACHVLAQV